MLGGRLSNINPSVRVHMGPGNYGLFPVHLYPYSPHFLLGKNDINIDKNRYNFLARFLHSLSTAILELWGASVTER